MNTLLFWTLGYVTPAGIKLQNQEYLRGLTRTNCGQLAVKPKLLFITSNRIGQTRFEHAIISIPNEATNHLSSTLYLCFLSLKRIVILLDLFKLPTLYGSRNKQKELFFAATLRQ